MSLLIQALVFVIAVGLLAWVVSLIRVEPLRTVAMVVLAVIVLVFALRLLGVVTWPAWGPRVEVGDPPGEESFAGHRRPPR